MPRRVLKAFVAFAVVLTIVLYIFQFYLGSFGILSPPSYVALGSSFLTAVYVYRGHEVV